jgi:hypothetical protein
MRLAAIALTPILIGFSASAAPDSSLLTRIRAHMREYLARLPEYTCRITLERSARPNSHRPFNVIDRLRLDVAYANAQEYYAWPGDRRFERNIAELLAGRGMISEGSFALHMRKLFQTNDAEFGEPREADGHSIQVPFFVPSARSGFAISAGGGSAPSALRGSVWFDRENLNLIRLEVRVEDTPRTIRIQSTREVTSYARARIGDDDFVLPAESELTLRDRDGSERRNHTRYDEFHRYSASVTIHYGAGDTSEPDTPARMGRVAPGTRVTTTLEAGIAADAAIGDLVTGSGGVVARITGLRRAGNRWSLELLLLRVGNDRAYGVVRKNVNLPVPSGATFSWRTE